MSTRTMRERTRTQPRRQREGGSPDARLEALGASLGLPKRSAAAPPPGQRPRARASTLCGRTFVHLGADGLAITTSTILSSCFDCTGLAGSDIVRAVRAPSVSRSARASPSCQQMQRQASRAAEHCRETEAETRSSLYGKQSRSIAPRYPIHTSSQRSFLDLHLGQRSFLSRLQSFFRRLEVYIIDGECLAAPCDSLKV